jgi:hypothetical protein
MDEDYWGNQLFTHLYEQLGDDAYKHLVWDEKGHLFVRSGMRDYYTTAPGTVADVQSRRENNSTLVYNAGVSEGWRNKDWTNASAEAIIRWNDGYSNLIEQAANQKSPAMRDLFVMQHLHEFVLFRESGIKVDNHAEFLVVSQGLGPSGVALQQWLRVYDQKVVDVRKEHPYWEEQDVRDEAVNRVVAEYEEAVRAQAKAGANNGSGTSVELEYKIAPESTLLYEVGPYGSSLRAQFALEAGETFGKMLNNLTIEDAHQLLGTIGWAPVVGSFASGADAILYFSEGKYAEAALQLLQTIPGAKVVKYGNKAIKIIFDSESAAKKSISLFEGLSKAAPEVQFVAEGFSKAEKEIATTGKNIQKISSEKVNLTYPKDYEPPYKAGTITTEFTTTAEKNFVRVHGPNNRERAWVMEKSEIEGLTPEQIKDKFALPETPTYITDVKVPKDTRMRMGIAGRNKFGSGEGIQYELLDVLEGPEVWQNTRKLGE